MRTRISHVRHEIASQKLLSTDIERLLIEQNTHLRFQPNSIESITGIHSRYHVVEGQYNSHLAAAAAQKSLKAAGVATNEIDLLIFAAAGQDLIEPATAHIVSEMLGCSCPVFDIKNACNSFLCGIEVASALIEQGRYKRVLITTGETPSKCIKWKLDSRQEFKKRFAGFTFGDAGAACIVEASETTAGILVQKSMASSEYWNSGTLPGGGSRHPRGDEFSYFEGDPGALRKGFEAIGPGFIHQTLEDAGLRIEDIDLFCIHQVSLPFLEDFLRISNIPLAKVMVTIQEYGNMAAASLPVALSLALEHNRVRSGSVIAMIGLAGGISLHMTVLRY